MKLITFRHRGALHLGALEDERARSLAGALANPCEHLAALAAAHAGRLEPSGPALPLADLELLAPVPRPGKVICIGLNYRDHAAESGMPIPQSPLFFAKFGSCVVGPGAAVILPPGSAQTDYEAEMAVVIGATARRVSEADARSHVLGYACLNDVSARDFQFADGQWTRGKACDTFAPCGPFIADRAAVPDPHALGVRMRVNGRLLQDSSTAQLIFGVDALVAFLSRHVTLEPGDLISTGTPPGVGFARKPPLFLQPGDLMEVEVDGLGVLRNPVVGS